MVRIRTEIGAVPAYRPGRLIADVARERGLDPSEIVKLASNESPFPPLPSVQRRMAEVVGNVHRYPDNHARDLRHELAEHLSVDPAMVWIGAGSSELLRVAGMAVGGPGTRAIYAWPSFAVYRLSTVLGCSQAVEIPLRSDQSLDLDAMADAIDATTTVVYVCNPNNPTGTYRSSTAIERFVDRVPTDVLVVVDEAYYEFGTAEEFGSALLLSVSRPNVLTMRTFSKIHGLASLRIGYAIGQPDLITELRKAQAPFTVSELAQVAAVESLGHPAELSERRTSTIIGRSRLEHSFDELGVTFVPSQTNFVYFRMARSSEEAANRFLDHGVIIRPFSQGWVRVSVGSESENERFISALNLVVDRT